MVMHVFHTLGLVVVLSFASISFGQGALAEAKDKLDAHWSELNNLDISHTARSEANTRFIPLFAQMLSKDSLFAIDVSFGPGMFVIYPPDSSFRVITWELFLTENSSRHFGVVQEASNPEKLLPLFDASEQHSYRTKSILTRKNWFGQLYYDIIEVKGQDAKAYMLLGHDSKDSMSDFKIIEPLVFRGGDVYFGAPIIEYPHDMPSISREDVLSQDSLTNRLFLEHKEGSSVQIVFEKGSQTISYSHLSPIHESAQETYYNYVPDGTEAAFMWDGEYWRWFAEPPLISPNE